MAKSTESPLWIVHAIVVLICCAALLTFMLRSSGRQIRLPARFRDNEEPGTPKRVRVGSGRSQTPEQGSSKSPRKNNPSQRHRIQSEDDDDSDPPVHLASRSPIPAPPRGPQKAPAPPLFQHSFTCKVCKRNFGSSGAHTTHERVCKRGQLPQEQMYEDAFYDGGDEEEPEDYSHLTEDHAPMLVNIPNPSEEESVTFEPVTPVTPGDGGRFHCHATGKSFPQIIFNLREEFPTSKGTRALTLLEGKKIINEMKWLHGSVSTPNDAARRDGRCFRKSAGRLQR